MKNFQRAGKLASTGLSIFLLSPALSGCFFTQRSELIVETENLSKALDEGSSVLKEYFLTLNDFDREGFKLVLSLNKDCDLQSDYTKKDCFYFSRFLSDSNSIYKSPLELSPYITNESLNTRLQLLNLLSEYAKSLAALASDESPEKFKQSILKLRSSSISLQNRIKSASNASGQPTALSDTSLQDNYLTPLGEIVSILGKIYLNESKWNAIFQSVKDASPRIDVLLNSLETDIVYAEAAYRNIAQGNAAALNRYYSQYRASISNDERKRILDAYEYYNTMQANLKLVPNKDGTRSSKAVNGLITPIRKAHSKLASLSSNSQYNVIAEIRALLATYDTEVQEIRALILKYKQ
jgi:hypothetical protein